MKSVISVTFSILCAALLLASCSKKEEAEVRPDSTGTSTPPPVMMTPEPEGGYTAQERNFIATALIGSKSEVELGKLALTQSKSPSVKALAQAMVDDHSSAYNELLQIAINKQLTIDTTVSAMQAQSKALLAQLSGPHFDKEFISVVVRNLEQGHNDFQLIATSATNAQLKAYAEKHLAAIAKLLTQARSLNAQ